MSVGACLAYDTHEPSLTSVKAKTFIIKCLENFLLPSIVQSTNEGDRVSDFQPCMHGHTDAVTCS